MNKTLLSICIATYNRAEYIGKTLESIIPQLTDDVEIVVVDGASTDNTNIVMTSYAELCKHIHYIRLPAKGGVDQDYDKSVEFAKGEFCWFFTDDDLLKPDAVSAVLAAIKEGHSLIIVNAEVRNCELSTVLEKQRVVVKKNVKYATGELERLFIDTVEYLSFIGAVVISRSLWLARDRKQYYGTEFVHVGVIFQDTLPTSTLLIAEPYIVIRYGNAMWSSRTFEIWMYKWPKLLYSFSSHISEEIRAKYRTSSSLSRLKRIVDYRAKGIYSVKVYKKWRKFEDFSFLWRFIILCVAIAPSFLLRTILLFYYRFFRKDRSMAIYELTRPKIIGK